MNETYCEGSIECPSCGHHFYTDCFEVYEEEEFEVICNKCKKVIIVEYTLSDYLVETDDNEIEMDEIWFTARRK